MHIVTPLHLLKTKANFYGLKIDWDKVPINVLIEMSRHFYKESCYDVMYFFENLYKLY